MLQLLSPLLRLKVVQVFLGFNLIDVMGLIASYTVRTSRESVFQSASTSK